MKLIFLKNTITILDYHHMAFEAILFEKKSGFLPFNEFTLVTAATAFDASPAFNYFYILNLKDP